VTKLQKREIPENGNFITSLKYAIAKKVGPTSMQGKILERKRERTRQRVTCHEHLSRGEGANAKQSKGNGILKKEETSRGTSIPKRTTHSKPKLEPPTQTGATSRKTGRRVEQVDDHRGGRKYLNRGKREMVAQLRKKGKTLVTGENRMPDRHGLS